MKNSGAFIQRLDVPPTAAGTLDGLTFAVKDVIDVAGTVTGCGNPTWAATHFPAAKHALAVELMLNSGARCLGKAISDELAFSLVGENHFYGTPLNPKAPDRVPGGSSSGSASAVAAGEVDFALGTDTAGSVRVPAANCGLYGLRPTWGRSPMAGVQGLAPSFDTVGLLAREVDALRRAANVLWQLEEPGTKISCVLMLEEAWALADEDVQAQRAAFTERVKAAGLEVKSVRLAELHEGELGANIFAWKSAFSGAQWPEVWSTFGGWLEHAKPEFGAKIAENFALARTYDRSRLVADLRIRQGVRQRLHAFLSPQVALCVPTTPSPPPLRCHVDYDRTSTGYLARTLCLTSFAGLAGLPQINLPWETAQGLPMGVSLVGATQADSALIFAAEEIG